MSELALWQYIFIAMWLVTWVVFSVVWWRGRKGAGKAEPEEELSNSESTQSEGVDVTMASGSAVGSIS